MRTESSYSGGRRSPHAVSFFAPRATVRCLGASSFRTQAARDLACLLDLDDAVDFWECVPLELSYGGFRHIPDFLVTYLSGERRLMDACDGHGDARVGPAASAAGYEHEFIDREQRERGWRLCNARDLLRYGNYRCPLGDRIRVLAALDEVGSFRVSDGLGLFREIPPMAGLAALVLQRMIYLELDEAPIGPDTSVRRLVR